MNQEEIIKRLNQFNSDGYLNDGETALLYNKPESQQLHTLDRLERCKKRDLELRAFENRVSDDITGDAYLVYPKPPDEHALSGYDIIHLNGLRAAYIVGRKHERAFCKNQSDVDERSVATEAK
jgi:hypothetical protein